VHQGPRITGRDNDPNEFTVDIATLQEAS